MTTRPLYVHVGVSKSGTSALQKSLWRSVDALAAERIGLPLVGRPQHVRRVLNPLGYHAAAGFDGDIDTDALSTLHDTVRRAQGDRLLMSVEDLAEADTARIRALLDVVGSAGTDVHVVVSARHLAKQLPSEWQQFLKHRRTIDYPGFLDEARTRSGADGENFWWRQDLLAVCARWGADLPPERVHVIAVPPYSRDPEGVFRLFASVLGFDHSVLQPNLDANVNESYGYLEAEMLRRFNVALGNRLSDYASEYMPAVRRVLVRQVIKRGASARITLPPDHLGWVRETAEGWVAELQQRGYRLYGDLQDLVPDSSAAAPLPELDDAEMAARAVTTLADFSVRIFEDQRREVRRPTASADPVDRRWWQRLRGR